MQHLAAAENKKPLSSCLKQTHNPCLTLRARLTESVSFDPAALALVSRLLLQAQDGLAMILRYVDISKAEATYCPKSMTRLSLTGI